ncbi:MAG: LamG domain-containing protein [Verrucomicrobia bacterium]|nr:LamG domain-containing protein [Verrucomicrobiota bacterium]
MASLSLFFAMKKIFRFCLIASLAIPCALFARRDEGLLFYMDFDDAKNPVKNVCGQDREASIFGMRPTARVTEGKFVYSASFKNGNGRSTEPNNYAVNLGELDGYFQDSFSVAFWFKTEKTGSTVAMISGNKDWLKPNDAGWAITAIDGKNLSLSVGGQHVNIGFPKMTDGDWHHVALVVDRKTGTVAFYGDGKKLGSQKIPAGTIGTGIETLVGGSGNGAFSAPGSNNDWAYIDDYAIWTRPLTEKEIVAMWDEGQGARVPEPSAFPLIFGLGALAATFALARRRK